MIGILFLSSACVPKDNFTTTSTGSTQSTTTTTTTNPTGSYGTNINACGDIQGYDDLATCKLVTYAQCYPSTKTVQNTTKACYFPVANWTTCPSNPATWSYGAWSSWCIPDSGYPGNWQRTRTATCNRPVAACECITAATPTDNCVVSGNSNPNGYNTCPSGVTPLKTCATPTPTPYATATPTATPTWCDKAVLNFNGTSGDSSGIFQNIINYGQQYIYTYYQSKGYFFALHRSTTGQFGSSIVNPDEYQGRYVLQVEAYKDECKVGFIVTGHKTKVHLLFYKDNKLISENTDGTECPNFRSNSGAATTAFQRARDGLNIPNCQ